MAKKKILIVEDEFILGYALRRELLMCGYEVCEVASTGEDAIIFAQREKPDIVIMDISLGDQMDGIEAGKEIKSSLGIPIIYLTGYSDEELRERAKIVEPHGYFVKPVSIEELKSTINAVIKDN